MNCRGLEVVVTVAARTAEMIPSHVHALAADRDRWHDQRDIDRLERQRLDQLPDATNAGSTANKAEGHVGTEVRRAGDICIARPPQNCGGIRGSATKPATEWEPLIDVDGRSTTHVSQRLADEVGPIER